jgi:hypothetical protein
MWIDLRIEVEIVVAQPFQLLEIFIMKDWTIPRRFPQETASSGIRGIA